MDRLSVDSFAEDPCQDLITEMDKRPREEDPFFAKVFDFASNLAIFPDTQEANEEHIQTCWKAIDAVFLPPEGDPTRQLIRETLDINHVEIECKMFKRFYGIPLEV